MASTDEPSVQSLPVLYVRASSHYDVGKTIGSTFRAWICEYMDTTEALKLQKFYQWPSGRTIYEQYLAAAEKCCPQTVAEIRGMADGAGQPFENVFLLQIYSEVLFYHLKELFGSEDVPTYGGEGCTDILVNKPGLRMIAHNDDWGEDVGKRAYIVNVTIESSESKHDGTPSVKPEHFVSFAYPGYLPGFCFGMNEKLVITLNTLTPVKAFPGRVPVLFLLRALLACDTIEECQRTMQNDPLGCAYGMNINIATIEGNEMYSLEVYPDESGTKVHVHNVPHDSGSDSFFHHQNHYKHLSADEDQADIVGSKLRDKRVTILGTPQTPSDVRNILGDTEDPFEPLFRVPCERHYEKQTKTVATAMFNITEKRLDVYRGNPKLAKHPCLWLPFLQGR